MMTIMSCATVSTGQKQVRCDVTYARFVLGVPANRHSEVREGLSQEFFFFFAFAKLRCGRGGVEGKVEE